MQKELFPIFLRIMTAVLFIVFAGLVLLYVFQEKLIYYPQKMKKNEADTMLKLCSQHSQIDLLSIETEKDVRIHGWLVKNPDREKSPVIIYFGGNAEEISYLVHYANKIKGWSLALMNYRGYGLSEGRPTEKNLYHDAVLLYDYLSRREDIDRERIIVMGRSLGTGVATYLAQQRQVAGVILVSPYDSLISVGKEVFPFLPVRLLLRNRFDSLSRAPSISAALLVIVATDDHIVHPRHSKKLLEKWGGPVSLKVIEGEDHNTIHDNAQYWEMINAFLANVYRVLSVNGQMMKNRIIIYNGFFA